MPHQEQRPSTIAIEIDHMLEESVRRKKFQLLKEIRASFQFRELILLAHGADIATNDNLAQAILDARWKSMPVGPVVERYAQTYIYPHIKKHT